MLERAGRKFGMAMAPAIEVMQQHQDGRFTGRLTWQRADPRFDPLLAFDSEESDLAETTRPLFRPRPCGARGVHGSFGRGDPPEESLQAPVATRGGIGWSGLAPGPFIVATNEIAGGCSWTGGLRVRGDEA